VGNAPVVTNDGNGPRLLLPPRQIGTGGGLESIIRYGRREQKKNRIQEASVAYGFLPL